MRETRVKGTVKVMRSYDYCHFEVCLGIADEELMTLQEVNELRKDAQRLADEAVRQYIKAKSLTMSRLEDPYYRALVEEEVKVIRKKPESEWTPSEKAEVKALQDYEHYEEFAYDYEDDEI